MTPKTNTSPSVRGTFLFCLVAVGVVSPLNVWAILHGRNYLFALGLNLALRLNRPGWLAWPAVTTVGTVAEPAAHVDPDALAFER